MKAYFFFIVLLATGLSAALAQPSRLYVDGAYYTNNQTAYIDCQKSSVTVSIDPVVGIDPATGQPAIAPMQTQTSLNFSTSDTQSDIQKTLNLDANHQDGYIDASTLNFNPGNFIRVYISQKAPAPTFSSVPTLCSNGQTGTLSGQVAYNFQSNSPVTLIWNTSGGITVNGGSTYSQTSTNGSVSLGYRVVLPKGT
jgi:hypothetical protein